jgi:single-strand DNA-binding protein
MNKLTIIGNLCKNPELRTTQAGKDVCSFTVAVSRRNAKEGQPDADYFRVSAWEGLGRNCKQYLAKGRKVCVIGAVSVSTYTGNDGTTRAQMDVLAQDVEFLSPKDAGYTQVSPADNPFDVERDELPM